MLFSGNFFKPHFVGDLHEVDVCKYMYGWFVKRLSRFSGAKHYVTRCFVARKFRTNCDTDTTAGETGSDPSEIFKMFANDTQWGTWLNYS